MPKKLPASKKDLKGLVIGKGEGLRFEYIRFIDEYMKDFNQTRAYMEVFKTNRGTASNRGAELMKYEPVKAEIKARIEAQQVTDSFVVDGLREIATSYRGHKTIGSAVRSYEILAKIRGMIKPDNQTNFFETNIAIFNPVVDIKGKKDLDEIIEAKGRLIE